MPNVELVYDESCPNVAQARANMTRALNRAGLTIRWAEWSSGSDDAPPHSRGYGSPTVLIDGKDVAGAEPITGMSCCRLYSDAKSENLGAPTVEMIESALTVAGGAKQGGSAHGWKSSLITFPGVAAAFLPAVTCPLCWPAYAGLLSALGMSFLFLDTYLLPLTAGLLVIALAALWFGGKKRGDYKPFTLGLVGVTVLLVGRFAVHSSVMLYTGAALLVVASFWNAWPRRSGPGCKDPGCRPQAPANKQESLS